MVRGITAQLRADNLLKDGCYGIQALDGDGEVLLEMHSPAQFQGAVLLPQHRSVGQGRKVIGASTYGS